MKFLKIIYNWWAQPAYRSWIAHTLVSLGFALIWSIFGSFHNGATVAACFYFAKEAGDIIRHAWDGDLMEDDPSGVPYFQDGVGDLVGPVALALGAWNSYLLG